MCFKIMVIRRHFYHSLFVWFQFIYFFVRSHFFVLCQFTVWRIFFFSLFFCEVNSWKIRGSTFLWFTWILSVSLLFSAFLIFVQHHTNFLNREKKALYVCMIWAKDCYRSSRFASFCSYSDKLHRKWKYKICIWNVVAISNKLPFINAI